MKTLGWPLVYLIASTLAHAQSGTVLVESSPVLAQADKGSATVTTLHKGDAVVLEFRMTGTGGISWCSVRVPAAAVSGYVPCSDLQIESAPESSFVRSAAPAAIATPVDELMRVSGIAKQFEQLGDPNLLAEGLLGRGVPPAEAAKLTRTMQDALTPEVFLRAIRSELQRGFNPTYAERSIAWFRTPVGQRVTNAEVQATSPASTQKFAAYARQLQSNPPKPARLALVTRLDAVVDVSKVQYEMVRSLLRGLASRLNPSLAPENRLDEDRLNAIMAKLEAQRPALRNLTLARLLYTYSMVSDDDLAAYVQFWETEGGRWLRSAYFRGALTGVESAAIRMVDGLRQAFPTKPAPRQRQFQ